MGQTYGLRIRGTEEIRYIGLTKHTAEYRLRQHLKEARRKNTRRPVSDWIKKHGEDNIETVVFLTTDTYDELVQDEVQRISQYRDEGAHLLNLTDGGEGTSGWVPTDEWLAAVSATGRKHTEETKQKIRESSLNRKHDEATKKKMSDAWTEERRIIASTLMKSDKRRFIPWTEDRRQKISQKTVHRNHVRWHINRGIVSGNCDICMGR